MPKFELNQTVSISESSIKVDELGVGAHRFSLVVVDNDGEESEPSTLDVIIRAGDRPTAVLDLVDGEGRRIEPTTIVGRSLTLSGARSSDVEPGRVVEYRFTLIA